MKKTTDFRKLAWPKRLNLHLLAENMNADTFMEILKAGGPNKLVADRTIILPSWTIFRKVLAHYLWKQVVEGNKKDRNFVFALETNSSQFSPFPIR